MNTKTMTSRLLKAIIRIFIWGLAFICISIVTLIVLGYFTASRPVSNIPEVIPASLIQKSSGSNQVGLTGSSYIVKVQKNGSINVNTPGGENIISNLTYYASYEGVTEKWGLDNTTVKLSSDSTILIKGEGLMGVRVSMLLTVPKSKPKLEVSINTKYSKTTTVNREALVAVFDVPVSEVYSKNREIIRGSFDREYWLDKQGVRFGNGLKSALVYNTQFVSSLQLDTKRNLLFLNLEYSLDHPFIHVPYQPHGEGKWVDLSTASYLSNNERNNSFSISIGENPKAIPRIMLVPNGFLAGYVFTEHADGGNIRTHRAAYFGSEDISRVEDAVGGFVGHKIPVTKSVFYTGAGNLPGSSIKDDTDWPQYLDFLDQLNATGNYDICLHTPDGSNSNRSILEESIQFMKNRFDTKSWIDHGMYSGLQNRECMVADGLDPGSEFYAADLWEKYNTLYFWSPAVEVIRETSLVEKIKNFKLYEALSILWERYLSPEEISRLGFLKSLKVLVRRYQEKGDMNSLRPEKGSTFPSPLFWQHPTRTKNFYTWVTDYTKEVSELSQEKVDLEQRLIDELILNKGVFFNHGYYVRNEAGDDIIVEPNGKLVINPYYDKILEIMAHKMDIGDLYIATVRDLMDYLIQTGKVSFEYTADGEILVCNAGDKPVLGLSLIVQSDSVLVNGEKPMSRRVGDNTIFWFDLPANQKTRLKVDDF